MISAYALFKANDPEFMKHTPRTREEIIASERKHPPRECVECLFFSWLFGEDKRISGGQCAIELGIAPDKFDYHKVAERCPLRE